MLIGDLTEPEKHTKFGKNYEIWLKGRYITDCISPIAYKKR